MEISIKDFEGISIGQTENEEAGTGCTVFLSKTGMRAGVDIRGGGPAGRETQLLNPLMAAKEIHAVVLAGGSAYGLGAAGGVMSFLEEKGIGYDVGVTKVSLVVQSDIFDLTVGSVTCRPDETMGYEAARIAYEGGNYRNGNYGAGCGATVGKIAGMDRCMKTGIGSFCMQVGDLKVGAVVVLNALGDIYDYRNQKMIAGLLTPDRKAFSSTITYMKEHLEVMENKFTTNTTLAVVMTNAYFEKPQLCKIAGMAQDGYARSIFPVHTSADGDTIYALSLGDVPGDMDQVGTFASIVVSEAILWAVQSAKGAYGYPSARDVGFL